MPRTAYSPPDAPMITLPPLITRGAMVNVYDMLDGRNARLPNRPAGLRVERAHPAVHYRRDHHVLIQRDSAIHHAAANARLPDFLIHFRVRPPQFLARARVHRINDAPRRDAVEHAIVHQRRSFLVRLRTARRGRNVDGTRPGPAG